MGLRGAHVDKHPPLEHLRLPGHMFSSNLSSAAQPLRGALGNTLAKGLPVKYPPTY